MNEGQLWSFIRDCMVQGQHIDNDHKDKGYEAMSARLDAAAAERADKLWKELNGQTFSSETPFRHCTCPRETTRGPRHFPGCPMEEPK